MEMANLKVDLFTESVLNLINISYLKENVLSNLENTVFFSDKKFANLIFIPVKLNGDMAIAMLDTGAQISVVSESIAKKHNITKNGETKQARNNNGASLPFDEGLLNLLEIDNIKINNTTLGIIPDVAFELGEDSDNNIFPAKMLLGWDIISQICWEFDMNNRFVKINRGGVMPKRVAITWNQFPIVDVVFKDEVLQMGFDSGHTGTLFDNSWLSRLDQYDKKMTKIQGIGSSNTELVYTIKNLSLNFNNTSHLLYDIEIVNHKIFGAENNTMVGLLGADFIEGKKWMLDYKSRFFEISK